MSSDSEFLGVVEKLYGAAVNDHDWTESLDAISALFGAVSSVYEVIENTTKRPISLDVGTGLKSFEPGPDYLEYYGSISPRVRHSFGKPAGHISFDRMILTETEMDRNEFYTDCIQPVGLRYFIAAQVLVSDHHQAVIAAQRSQKQGHIEDHEIALMKRLLPHLQQASDLKFRLADSRIGDHLPIEGLEQIDDGCLLIEGSGRVLHLNARANEIVFSSDGVSVTEGNISFDDKIAGRTYRRIISDLMLNNVDTVGRDFSVHRPSGNRPFLVSVRPLPPENGFSPYRWSAAAIVFIRDPMSFGRLNTDLLRQSYRLTDIELEIATALDRGAEVKEIAQAREVSLATVRTQLYSLMSKLKVRRQTELIRLLSQYRRPFT